MCVHVPVHVMCTGDCCSVQACVYGCMNVSALAALLSYAAVNNIIETRQVEPLSCPPSLSLTLSNVNECWKESRGRGGRMFRAECKRLHADALLLLN